MVATNKSYKLAGVNAADQLYFDEILNNGRINGATSGVTVKQGQQLGSVGDTALIEMTDEPHLHFEVTENGEQVDPLTFFSDEDREALSGS